MNFGENKKKYGRRKKDTKEEQQWSLQKMVKGVKNRKEHNKRTSGKKDDSKEK